MVDDARLPVLSRVPHLFLAVVLATVGLVLAPPAPAQAAVTSPLLLPFSPGQTWYVCQGYESTNSHVWNAQLPAPYALDVTMGGPCNANASANQPALSPWRGSVSHKWTSTTGRVWEGICINLEGGGSFKIGHIAVATQLVAGSPVGIGQQVGTVHPADLPADDPNRSSDNNGVAHQHIEAYAEPGCDGSRSWIPFSGNARMQCAPDLYNAPASTTAGGEWRGTALTRLTDADAKAGTPFWDICANPFAPDIRWMWQSGLTNGCASDRFCPQTAVTRDTMARFLVRLYGYGPAPRDYFWDDAGNMFEDDINRLAAAGITNGCVGYTATTQGQYCPYAIVSRAQAAALISRAEGLPPTAGNYFWDDNGHPLEDPINRMAAAGLFNGCGDGKACPDDPTTREQAAAFLHRAANR